MPILITSTGLSFPKAKNIFLSYLKVSKNKKALIITTAAEGKSKNKYSVLAKTQLLNYGIKSVEFFDLEKNKNINLSKFDVVYACGGNTFKLMKFINLSNFKAELLKFLNKGGLYIGVSAGSIVLGPDIKVASFGTNGDKNNIGLNNLSGMNILSFVVLPHFEEKYKTNLMKFNKNLNYIIKPLSNEDVIFIK